MTKASGSVTSKKNKHKIISRKKLIVFNYLSLLWLPLFRFALWFYWTGSKAFLVPDESTCKSPCSGKIDCIQVCVHDLRIPTWGYFVINGAIVLGIALLVLGIISAICSLIWLKKNPQEKKLPLIISMFAVVLAVIIAVYVRLNFRMPV